MLNQYNRGSGKNLYKNSWVFTGADSIIQTFKRAKYNFDLMESGQALPETPRPPSIFNVTSGGDRIIIDWTNEAESSPGFDGYNLYRLKFKPDTTLFAYNVNQGLLNPIDESIATLWRLDAGQNEFQDVTAERGFDYFYFLEAFDNGTNDIKILNSSKFYTITNKAASLKRPAGESFEDIRVVPNPYHISSRDFQYGVSAPDRLMFLNILPSVRSVFLLKGEI